MKVTQDFVVQSDGSADDDLIDLSRIFGALWRRKFWILAITAGFGLVAGYYAFAVAEPKYQATSVVLLETQESTLVDLGAILPNLGSDSEAINTEVEVLKSRRLIERVVAGENLTEDPEFNGALRSPSMMQRARAAVTGLFRPAVPPVTPEDGVDPDMARAVNAVLGSMNVRNVPNTYVLQVTVTTGTPLKSMRLANRIAEEYILYQMDVKFDATKEASEWLSSRVADLKQDLETAEARVAEFATNSEVVSEESVQGLDRQVKELRDRLVSTRATLVEADAGLAGLEVLRSAPAAEKAEAVGDTRLSTILREDGAGEAFDTRFEQIIARAELQARRAREQVTSLTSTIAAIEDQIATQSAEMIQLQQLTREAEASRLLYEYFLGRLKETSAQEGIQQPDARILSNAQLPGAPSEPRKSMILTIALFLGLLAGSGVALLWEARRNNYRLARDLEAESGLPVMGQIPLLPAGRTRRDTLTYLSRKPTSAAAEAVRNLRTSVLLSGPDKTPQVIMPTSSVPSEGKTTISFALAQSLTGMGKKVLLLEGDIRRLVFGEYLNITTRKGLISVLSDEISLEEAVVHDPLTGADVLLSEPSKVNAADVLSSPRFAELIAEARERYDFVIIDTPPVLVVPDARVVAQQVDAVLFTVRWDKTSKTQVQEALRMFETVGVRITGLLLNQIDPKGMRRYGYGDSYGAYGAYGKKYYTN
ncbi:GumC family protein [Celeribacter indicus]|uniref:non-specific protein-tyrosine kinase n=1 Tax=Celeribacter indicus TaxID=1208324 RepID=A0A0B5E9L8_9RHOB|nr:polysaccharide biosynthesis tyrosine autokinase [Celeribacter indicus]AJE49037.1 lipopolysaccharide biosynthesis family protein [Celeribacter indicus]SDW44310.1 capsular exopolysaccharide family [Celeribacter indicus]